jgi:hypothetical protein
MADRAGGQNSLLLFSDLGSMTQTPNQFRRLRAAGIHFLASVGVAAIAAVMVFRIWYPHPFSAVAGGLSLFMLLVSVDVILGPALTAVAASPAKPVAELRRDLAVIVVVQLAAFIYGVYTIAMARPVHLAFEVDRMHVVTAADIEPTTLRDALPEFRRLPWFGPTLVGAAKPTKPEDQTRAFDLGVAGIDLAMIPANWRDYASQSDEVWARARPAQALIEKYPQSADGLDEIASASGQPIAALRFLPLQSRQASWVTIVAAPGSRVVGHLPFDGFF